MPDDKNGQSISQTLYIPLAVRAQETKRPDPLVKDDKAVEIMDHVNLGDMVVDGGPVTTHGILARTTVIDDELHQLLAAEPTTTVINLGAGLDTRLNRLDNGRLRWFDLDLPDVIALRRTFFPEDDRRRLISGSVLDEAWTEKVRPLGDSNIVIIAEGLLMYFAEPEVRLVFHLLTDHFPRARMYCDVVHSFFVGRGVSSPFRWGVDRATDIEHLGPRVRLVGSWSTGDLLKERQPRLLRLGNRLTSTRNRSQILSVRFSDETDSLG